MIFKQLNKLFDTFIPKKVSLHRTAPPSSSNIIQLKRVEYICMLTNSMIRVNLHTFIHCWINHTTVSYYYYYLWLWLWLDSSHIHLLWLEIHIFFFSASLISIYNKITDSKINLKVGRNDLRVHLTPSFVPCCVVNRSSNWSEKNHRRGSTERV